MFFHLFQMGGAVPTGVILTFSILGGVGFLFCVLFLKMGLAAVKANRRRNFKWVAVSFFIQAVVILMMGSPFILLGFAGAFDNGGPEPGPIIFVIVIAIFIDMNVINVIHQTGLLKAFWPFLLMAIPIGATVGFGVMIARVGLFIPM